jgi:hypothetical protein
MKNTVMEHLSKIKNKRMMIILMKLVNYLKKYLKLFLKSKYEKYKKYKYYCNNNIFNKNKFIFLIVKFISY